MPMRLHLYSYPRIVAGVIESSRSAKGFCSCKKRLAYRLLDFKGGVVLAIVALPTSDVDLEVQLNMGLTAAIR